MASVCMVSLVLCVAVLTLQFAYVSHQICVFTFGIQNGGSDFWISAFLSNKPFSRCDAFAAVLSTLMDFIVLLTFQCPFLQTFMNFIVFLSQDRVDPIFSSITNFERYGTRFSFTITVRHSASSSSISWSQT